MLEDREYSLLEIFSLVSGQIRAGYKYFVQGLPLEVSFGGIDLVKYQIVAPFFLHKIDKYLVWENRKVVPYLWDKSLGPSDERFGSALSLTGGDSCLFALCAVSGENYFEQARLFRFIADEILAIHAQDAKLVNKWIRAQTSRGPVSDASSLDAFALYDLRRFEKTLDENELLVLPILDEWGEVELDRNKIFWKNRLKILIQAVKADTLAPNHLRWIEYLSHSVDVAGLLAKIQDASGGRGSLII